MNRTKSINPKIMSFAFLTAILVALISIQANTIFAQSSTENAGGISNTVNAGGNGSDWDNFNPQNITITAGESVTWINPMSVPEPHTVTFLKDPNLLPPLVAPFNIPNNTKLTSAIPSPNVEPTVLPDQSNPSNKLVVVDNARASSPVAIDQAGSNVTHLHINANYTLTGYESFINSGWIWPKGQSPAGAPPISSFTLTFENAGTYGYMCAVHPWMSGIVKVNPK
jgi:plastocyanin